jgi:hypothetical protein
MHSNFRQTFRDRLSEWFLSVALIGWGFITLNSNGFFEHQEPLYSILLQWGGLAVLVGITRFIFLIINGAWRPSAHIRALGCIFGCLTWGTLLLSTPSWGWNTPTTALYATFLSLDFISLWFASGDAKIADIEAKARHT